MLGYIRSRAALIDSFRHKIASAIESERRRAVSDRMALLREYEARVDAEVHKAVTDTVKRMSVALDERDRQVRAMEIELIDQRNSFRDFREDVQSYEILADTIDTEIQSALMIATQLGSKFQGIRYRMDRIARKIDRKDRKLLEGGK